MKEHLKKKSFETYARAKHMHNHLLKSCLFLFLLRKVFFLHSKNRNVLNNKNKSMVFYAQRKGAYCYLKSKILSLLRKTIKGEYIDCFPLGNYGNPSGYNQGLRLCAAKLRILLAQPCMLVLRTRSRLILCAFLAAHRQIYCMQDFIKKHLGNNPCYCFYY